MLVITGFRETLKKMASQIPQRFPIGGVNHISGKNLVQADVFQWSDLRLEVKGGSVSEECKIRSLYFTCSLMEPKSYSLSALIYLTIADQIPQSNEHSTRWKKKRKEAKRWQSCGRWEKRWRNRKWKCEEVIWLCFICFLFFFFWCFFCFFFNWF